MNSRTIATATIALLMMSPAVALEASAPDPVQQAFDRLHDAVGMDRVHVDPPTTAIAPVVDALAATVEARNVAFGQLDDPDRFWELLLHAHAPEHERTVESQEDRAWLLDQVDRVDITDLAEATRALVESIGSMPTFTASAWMSPGGLVEIGGPGNDCYTSERMLIIETGGDDCYDNFAATGTPWSALRAPVSVIVELGGDDVYVTSAQHPNHGDATWSQAVGIGGVGLLVDRWGDDRYDVALGSQNNACFGVHLQQTYGQGVGVLGIGALLDGSGNDRYAARSHNTVTGGCHWNLAYTFAQGVGMDLGIGILADDTGHDEYHASALESGDDPDNNAHTNAQGASIGGVGALVDKEGDDRYHATAHASASATSGQKGSHAYVFAQGANLESIIGPGSTTGGAGCAASNKVLDCLPTDCRLGTPGLIDAAGASCTSPSALLADLLGSDEYSIDVSTDSPGFCTVTSRAVGVGQGASGWLGTATLLDADHGVQDAFRAHTDARSDGCVAQSHLYVQGFAGELMYDRYDSPRLIFGPETVVHGALLSVGPIEHDGCLYKPPKVAPLGSQSQIVDDVVTATDPCALHVRTGLTDSYDLYDAWSVAVNPSGPSEVVIHAQGMANKGTPSVAVPVGPPTVPPKPVIPKPTTLSLADVLDFVGDLSAYAAGAVGGIGKVPGAPTPSMLPVGTHLDLAGHDVYNLFGETHGQSHSLDVKGQGAGVNGVGQLYAVGGSDRYLADARMNFIPVPGATHVQAYSEASQPWMTSPVNACFSMAPIPPLGPADPQCLYAGHDVAAAGILVDVFGGDEYSEAAERNNCQRNGSLFGTWPTGPTLGSPSVLGPSHWGTVLSWPCQNVPTATTGNGFSIGSDWWSDNGAW